MLQLHGPCGRRKLKAMARVTVLVPPLLVLSCGCNRYPGSKQTSRGKRLGRTSLPRPQGRRWGLHANKLMCPQHLHRISWVRLDPGVSNHMDGVPRNHRGATPGGWIFKVLPCRHHLARRVRLGQAWQELLQASLSPSKGVWRLHNSYHNFHHSHYPKAIHGQPVQPVQTDRLLGRMVPVLAITLRSVWAWMCTACHYQELQWQLQQKCGSSVCAWQIISSYPCGRFVLSLA